MKKVFKFGCLGMLGILVILFIIGSFTDTDPVPETSSDSTPETSKNIPLKDTATINQVNKMKEANRIDSMNVVNHEKAIKKLETFRKKIDEFEDLTFYTDKRAPVYVNRNFIYPYIMQSGNSFYLRLKFQYTSDDWLFIRQIKILTDENSYTITGDFKRDSDTTIWEWYDKIATPEDVVMLRDIAESKTAKIRYEGQQYYKDRIMTSKEKDIIKKTLDIYSDL